MLPFLRVSREHLQNRLTKRGSGYRLPAERVEGLQEEGLESAEPPKAPLRKGWTPEATHTLTVPVKILAKKHGLSQAPASPSRYALTSEAKGLAKSLDHRRADASASTQMQTLSTRRSNEPPSSLDRLDTSGPCGPPPVLPPKEDRPQKTARIITASASSRAGVFHFTAERAGPARFLLYWGDAAGRSDPWRRYLCERGTLCSGTPGHTSKRYRLVQAANGLESESSSNTRSSI